MPQKVGTSSQIINFNYVADFVSENLNRLMYSMFTPGVLKFTYTNPPLATEIEITEFSGLIKPKNKEFLIKVDTMTSFKLAVDESKPYLVARMDWLTPPNGYDYESANYGVSGYSGYFKDDVITCTFYPIDDKIIASPDHNLIVGDVVRFGTTIAGITKDIDYYVIEIDGKTSFKVSTTAAGTVVDIVLASKDLSTVTNTFRKMNSHIVRLDMVAETEIDREYDIVLGLLKFTTGWFTSIDITKQTSVFLHENCINYDMEQRDGVSTLEGTNPDHTGISGWSGDSGYSAYYVGNTSGKIPISNSTMNQGLNAEFLNGMSAGNADNNITLKNMVVCTNLITARLFLNGFEYAIGESGLNSYSGYSGYSTYSGISGWSGAIGYSSMSGYIPLSNSVLQTSLNAEYLGGYNLASFSPGTHTHNLDEIIDGSTYKKIRGVGTDGLVRTAGINDQALEYRHQGLTADEAFRHDNSSPATYKKIFVLTGEIGVGGMSGVTFRKTFATAPRVFLLNNETDEWKSVDEVGVSGTGFWVHHHENSKSDGSSVDGLVSDTTPFSTHWLACGELE